MYNRDYKHLSQIDVKNVHVAIHGEYNNKPNIHMHVMHSDGRSTQIAIVTPACTTHWPRCTGNGNLGTKFAPSDPMKAKYTLDLADDDIDGAPCSGFKALAEFFNDLDDKLLDLVFNNQEKCLGGRRNLSIQECAMLQNRTVKPKYDSITGSLIGHSMHLSRPKFYKDPSTGKYTETQVNICDHKGTVIPDAKVQQGDVVCATVYLSNVYTGVSDKFGISWGFEDVCIVRQSSATNQKSHIPVFGENLYSFATPYSNVTFDEMEWKSDNF